MGYDVGFAGCRYCVLLSWICWLRISIFNAITKTIELHYVYTNKDIFEDYNFDDRRLLETFQLQLR
jgi:hypothetical protein